MVLLCNRNELQSLLIDIFSAVQQSFAVKLPYSGPGDVVAELSHDG